MKYLDSGPRILEKKQRQPWFRRLSLVYPLHNELRLSINAWLNTYFFLSFFHTKL